MKFFLTLLVLSSLVAGCGVRPESQEPPNISQHQISPIARPTLDKCLHVPCVQGASKSAVIYLPLVIQDKSKPVIYLPLVTQ